MKRWRRCPLFLFLLGLYSCASPCLWEGDTCLAVELTGEGTLQDGAIWLGLRSQTEFTRGHLPAELKLPRAVTVTLPPSVAASDVLSVHVCAQRAAGLGSFIGSAALSWLPGSAAEVSMAVEPADSSDCGSPADLPHPMELPPALREPSFTVQRTAIAGLAPLSGVTLGNFYDSGRLDFAAVSVSQSAIVTLPALGDGGFGTANIFPQSRLPDQLVAADVDDDGLTDVLGPSQQLGVILSYYRDGKGRFGRGFQVPFSKMGSAPTALVMMDLTGDRKPELVLANSLAQGEVLVLSANGAVLSTSASGGQSPLALAAGDVNADGWNDVVVANHGSGAIQLLLNDHTGNLLTGPKVAQCTGPIAVELRDYNGDRKADLSVLCQADGTVQVLLAAKNVAGQLFTAPTVWAVESEPRFLVGGDFNRDGNLDLAVLHTSGYLGFLFGDGQGSFVYRRWKDGFGSNVAALLTEDLNGDGRADLLVVGAEELTSLLVD